MVEENSLKLDIKVNFKKACPDPDNPCNAVKATLDGMEVASFQSGRALDQLQISIPLTNEETENILRIVASNDEATSVPIEWKFDFRPRIAAKPNLIFLGIGISTFETFQPHLNFAREDAEKLFDFIKTQDETGPYGGKALYKRVIPKLLLDSDAKRTAINDALVWLNNQTKHDNDVRVVFISTHGGASSLTDAYYLYSWQQKNGDEAGTSLNLTDLWMALNKGSGKTILLIDACRKDAPRIDDIVHFVKTVNSDKNKEGKIIAFLASGVNEPSYENTTFQHGAFTYTVLEGLKDKATEADGPHQEDEKDGQIDVEELSSWITFRMRKNEPRQHPSPLLPEGLIPFPLYIYRSTP
jgi:hypothetical protein